MAGIRKTFVGHLNRRLVFHTSLLLLGLNYRNRTRTQHFLRDPPGGDEKMEQGKDLQSKLMAAETLKNFAINSQKSKLKFSLIMES